MTKGYRIRRHYHGSQLQERAPLDSKEPSSYRRWHVDISLPAVQANSSHVQTHPQQKNMTWNRTSSLFCRLVIVLSMIAVVAGYAETTPIDLDLEEEFFYAVESSDQTFGDSFHPEKDRSLQFGPVIIPDPIVIPGPIAIPTLPIPDPIEIPGPIVIPTLPPFGFQPIPPIVIQFGKPSLTQRFVL
jgi:hypothetical protein